jgi:hypothetical protein
LDAAARTAAGTLLAASALVACVGGDPVMGQAGKAPPLAQVLVASTPGWWRSTGNDVFEVWVCRVPPDTTLPLYGGLPVRHDITPEGLTALLNDRVPDYFDTVSEGVYRPSFTAGGDVALGPNDPPTLCVDEAIRKSQPASRAVLVVADADHAEGFQGGIASAGSLPNGSAAVPVKASGRYVYVGGTDFADEWGDNPPLDLVEHEMGHTLGWVHSGVSAASGADGADSISDRAVVTAAGEYRSPLDLMSDSAAPRDTNPDRRDGPAPLAVHRLLAGWLPIDSVLVTDEATTVELEPTFRQPESSEKSGSGVRMLVLAVDANSFLTAELRLATGFDDHLPHDGLVVHLVTVENGAIASIEPQHGGTDEMPLLHPGDPATGSGWSVEWRTDGTVKASKVPVTP